MSQWFPYPYMCTVLVDVRAGCTYRVGILGGYTGWVIRRGTTQHQVPTPSMPQTAERAPEAPRGLEWVVWGMRPRDRSPEHQVPPTPTPAGSPGPAPLYLVLSPSKAASWPIRARLHLILLKVSQNGIVSPKYVEKASHSPCFQNPSRKSPLEILRFPFSLAFSAKELMGHFDGQRDFTVKMTKCRLDVPSND